MIAPRIQALLDADRALARMEPRGDPLRPVTAAEVLDRARRLREFMARNAPAAAARPKRWKRGGK